MPSARVLSLHKSIGAPAEGNPPESRLRGTRLICPLHGASFDARDGRVLAPPATAPLCQHAVRISDGVIEVALAGGAAVRVNV